MKCLIFVISPSLLCSVHYLVSGGQCLLSLLQEDSLAQAKQPRKQCLHSTLALYNDIKMSQTSY